MSASANQQITRADDCRNGVPVAASVHIYEGTLAFQKSSGYLDSVTNSGANPFAGIAVIEVDNSNGSNGDLVAELFTEGKFLLTGSGFSQATVGQRIFATDNYTVTTDSTASGAVYIGICSGYVSATQIYVSLDEAIAPKFSAYTQTYATVARTVPAATQVAVATTAATNSSPYGFAQAQADALVTAVNAAGADILALKKVVNALIDDLQAAGLAG